MSIIGWIFYGLIVGAIAKFVHPGEEPIGCLPTVGIGIAGSYIGGAINYFLGNGTSVFSPSGLLMGIVGGVIFCFAYSWYKTK